MCATEVFSSASLVSTPGFNPWAAPLYTLTNNEVVKKQVHRMSVSLKQTVRNTWMLCTLWTNAHENQRYIYYAVWIRFTKKQKQHAGATRRHRSPAACHASDRLFVCLLIATFVSRLCSCPGCCFSGGSPGKLSSVTLICPDWTEVTIVGQACSSSGFLPHINKHREGHTCPLFLHFCWIYRFILATWLCPLFFI